MRAKYINKQARRRTIRPDGDHYREMRKWRGESRARIRRLAIIWLSVIALAAAAVALMMMRG